MSWTVLPVNQAQVREFLDVVSTTGQMSDGRIGSNIRAAASFLQRATNRRFEPSTTAETMSFTTEGRSYVAIPDVRSVTSITLQGTALTADSTYYLVADGMHSGVYTGIQFRTFGGRGVSYLANPEWFDRGLDNPVVWARLYPGYSLPNDLAVTSSTWGWSPLPDEFLFATLMLAAFYTRRPASVLADVAITPDGHELRYSQLPVEVQNFIKAWQSGDQLVSVR